MDNALGASIRALEEVVTPALDPADPLAAEQLALVIDNLKFLRERLDFQHDRARFDLRHHLKLAQAIRDDVGLDEEIEAATALYDRADARTPELRDGAAVLAAALRTAVREADDDVRPRIELAIVAGSRERIEA